MKKPLRVWISASASPRVLVPAGVYDAGAAHGALPLCRSVFVQGAELAGPWLLRAAVRLPHASVADPGEDACRWLGAVHMRWLRHLGIQAAALHHGRPVAHWASFVTRGPGDVVVGPRKITSITRVRRVGETLLMAGTLLEMPPWVLLCRALRRPEQEAAFISASAVCASALVPDVQTEVWATYLRSMLHLSLALTELQDGLGVD